MGCTEKNLNQSLLERVRSLRQTAISEDLHSHWMIKTRCLLRRFLYITTLFWYNGKWILSKGKFFFSPFVCFFSYTYVLNFQNNTLFLVLFIQQTPRLYSKLLTDLFSPSLFPPMHSPHSCHCDLSKMQIKNSSSWNPWIDPQGLQNEVGTP